MVTKGGHVVVLLSPRCWDTNEHTALWWVIKGPVVASIMVLFLYIIYMVYIIYF